MRSLKLYAALTLLVPTFTFAQNPVYRMPRLPAPAGFRVLVVPDMEGMGSTIMSAEVSGAPPQNSF